MRHTIFIAIPELAETFACPIICIELGGPPSSDSCSISTTSWRTGSFFDLRLFHITTTEYYCTPEDDAGEATRYEVCPAGTNRICSVDVRAIVMLYLWAMSAFYSSSTLRAHVTRKSSASLIEYSSQDFQNTHFTRRENSPVLPCPLLLCHLRLSFGFEGDDCVFEEGLLFFARHACRLVWRAFRASGRRNLMAIGNVETLWFSFTTHTF